MKCVTTGVEREKFMQPKITLYVNSSVASNTVPWHTQKCWSAGCNALANHPIIESTDYLLNHEELQIRKLLEEYTEKHRIDLEIFDISLKATARKARLKGIKKTPVLYINGKKIIKIPGTEGELRLLF